MPEIKKYLNRDGLEEYNSLLPHSSGEMQEYANDWFDAHPEATTTVQDGAITERKLADKSISLRTLAADTAHMLKGMMITGNLSGEVITADDAYSAPPVALTVDGRSTQDGTPTPDAPVPIESIEVLNLSVTFAGKNLFDKVRIGNHSNWNTSRAYAYIAIAVPPNTPITAHYNHAPFSISNCYLHMSSAYGASAPSSQYLIANSANNASNTVHATSTVDGNIYLNMYGKSAETLQTIMNAIGDILQIEVGDTASEYVPFTVASIIAQIPMQGHVLRSLPDGTHDTMTLSYLRESDRAGWAWYASTLTVNTGVITVNDVGWSSYNKYSFYSSFGSRVRTTCDGRIEFMSTFFAPETTTSLGGSYVKPANTIFGRNGWPHVIVKTDTPYDSTTEFKAAYADATIIFALATPVITQLNPVELPVLPAPNCTVWSDPTTGLRMEYVRDSNIVIQRIEEAIADQ